MAGERGGLVGAKDDRGVEGEADAERGCAFAEELVERGSPEADSGEGGEAGGDASVGVGEGDAGEREAVRIGIDSEGGEGAA